MRLFAKSAQATATAVAVLATAAMFGFSGSAQASETQGDWAPICMEQNGAAPDCAYGTSPVEMIKDTPGIGVTNWYYPASGQIGEIKQANTNRCMQADESSAENVIVEVTCTGNSDQEFSVKTYSDGNFSFESRWNTTDCLAWNASADGLYLRGCGDVYYESIVS
jgi:hypothetical protein